MNIATASKTMIALTIGAPILLALSVAGLIIFKGYALWEYPYLLMNGNLTWYIHVLGWIGVCVWIKLYWPKSLDAWHRPILISEDGDYIILRDWPIPIRKDEIEKVTYKPYSTIRKIVIHLANGEKIDQAAYLFSEDGYDVAERLRKLSVIRGE